MVFTEEELDHLAAMKVRIRKEAREQGLAEGRAEGRTEGRAEGLADTEAVLRKKGLPENLIAEVQAELEAMRQEKLK